MTGAIGSVTTLTELHLTDSIGLLFYSANDAAVVLLLPSALCPVFPVLVKPLPDSMTELACAKLDNFHAAKLDNVHAA